MKIFFATGVIASALINIGMGFSTILWLSVALWALNGWFQGFGAPSGIVTLTAWFSNRERGRFYGIWSTAHSFGEGLTYYVVAIFVAWLGWRTGFWVPGLFCILTGIGIYLLMQDRPPTLGLPTVADWKNDHLAPSAPPETRVRDDPALDPQNSRDLDTARSRAQPCTSRATPSRAGESFTSRKRAATQLAEASLFMAIYTIAGVAGCLLFGYLSDKFFSARRPPANLLFAIAELVGLVLIFYGPPNGYMLTFAFILFGVGLNGLITSLGGLFAVDIAPKKVAGAAMGLVGVFSYIGAAVQENISGSLIEANMRMVGDVRIYDFGPAIWFWIGSSVISMFLAATLWKVKLRE